MKAILSVREKLLLVVYCLNRNLEQMRRASLAAGILLSAGEFQSGRKIIKQKISPLRDRINHLFSKLNCHDDFLSPEQK